MEQRIIKKIQKNENLFITAQKLLVQPNKTYKTTTDIIGKKGLPYSSFFMVSIQGEDQEELKKCIKWINDFSGKPKEYSIIFKTPLGSKKIVLGYLVNQSTPVRSDVELDLPAHDKIKLQEVSNDMQETFDDRIKFEVPYFPPLKEDEEDELEKKIVWVFGSGRSGTTWLAERLLNHKENFYWNEPWIGRHLGVSNRIVSQKTGQPEFERIYDKMGKMQHTYFFYPGHKKNWLPALRKLILTRTYSEAQTIKKNIIIKEPVGSTASDIIMECLPNSKMIFLLRDGRDVVDSRIAMHGKKTWANLKTIKPQNRLKKITEYCYEWINVIDIIYKTLQNHNENLRLLVKYEDLRTNTEEELNKIYDFLRIKMDKEAIKKIVKKYSFENLPPSKKGQGKFNRSALIGGWKKNFNVEERKLVDSIMDKTLTKFEYKV